jgi:hypothetical protein
VIWTEAQQISVHLKLRKSRAQCARSLVREDPNREAREAQTEELMNAIYAKFRLTPKPEKPKDPMAMWTTPPEGLETWQMLRFE